MTTAFVLDTYPSLSETFIARELQALRDEGLRLLACALRKPAGSTARLTPNVDIRTRYALRGPSRTTTLQADAVAYASGPLTLTAALRLVGALMAHTVPGGLRLLRAFPYALALARAVRHDSVKHVHAHFATAPCEVGLLMAAMLRCSFSFSVHARDIYVRPGPALPWKTRHATFVAACTEHARGHLLQLAPATPPAKIVTIHHGVDPALFPLSQPTRPTLLAVGRLVPKKGFHVFLDACRLLKERGIDFHAVIAGDGPEAGRLRTQAAQLGLDDHLAWLGAQRPDQLVPQFHQARLLALPSVKAPDGDRDGIANVLIEAMACGVPVVTTTASAANEAIEDGVQGFLIPPEDSAALAKRIEQLLRSPAQADRLGLAGRQRVIERFDMRHNARLLARLLRQAQGSER